MHNSILDVPIMIAEFCFLACKFPRSIALYCTKGEYNEYGHKLNNKKDNMAKEMQVA